MRRIALVGLLALSLAGCAPGGAGDPLASLRQPDGSVLWQQEYAFTPPASPWHLVALDEDDYSVAFSLECRQSFPCQSTMAYAEEPFGYSKDLETRQKEFFRRYLWASRVVFEAPRLETVNLGGKTALVATVQGREPVKGQKVWSKVVFMHRGERVVAFYFNQWRAEGVAYDRGDEEAFYRFVRSFRFLKPSFYETL